MKDKVSFIKGIFMIFGVGYLFRTVAYPFHTVKWITRTEKRKNYLEDLDLLSFLSLFIISSIFFFNPFP